MQRTRGLLVGRPPLTSLSYEYVIVPERDDIDVALATLPEPVMSQMVVFNTTDIGAYLRGFYPVTFRRVDVPARGGGWITHAVDLQPVHRYEPVVVDPEKPVESVKTIDASAKYYELKGLVIDARRLLMKVAQLSASGTRLPKRFLATQVAVTVDGEPVLVPLPEAWLLVTENPGVVRGILVLPKYKFAVIVSGNVDRSVFMDAVVERAYDSTRAFSNTYRVTMLIGEEEE